MNCNDYSINHDVQTTWNSENIFLGKKSHLLPCSQGGIATGCCDHPAFSVAGTWVSEVRGNIRLGALCLCTLVGENVEVVLPW